MAWSNNLTFYHCRSMHPPPEIDCQGTYRTVWGAWSKAPGPGGQLIMQAFMLWMEELLSRPLFPSLIQVPVVMYQGQLRDHPKHGQHYREADQDRNLVASVSPTSQPWGIVCTNPRWDSWRPTWY